MNSIKVFSDQPATLIYLRNGLQCVHIQSTGRVSYCGVLVDAGSRDESENHPGLAHFVEHTLFKGTRKRRSHHIATRMESIGGELNAYTTKEETMIYTTAPTGFVARSMELLADIVTGSKFPPAELEREREVVIEEIKSYRDSPIDAVYDDFEDIIYAGSCMGHNILGNEKSVTRLGSSDCRAFIEKFYVTGNMVVYCSDPMPASKAEKILNKYFGNIPMKAAIHSRKTPDIHPIFDKVVNEDGHQAHTLMGCRTFNRRDPRRFALFLMNDYLGGPGMNSRLNRELRDRRGYVYTTESTVALMSDCGLFQLYFGTDTSRMERCRKIVMQEIDKLANNTMKAKVFEAAKRQYAGQLIVSSSNSESIAMGAAKSLLYFGELLGIDHTSERILSLQAEDIREIAELIAERGLSRLTLL